MTRIIVYGEYPPTPGLAAEVTLELVREYLAGGAEVEVVSPLPTAAHHHADLTTVGGVALLGRLARGAGLDLALDPALLAGRPELAPVQAGLALVVRRARHSTVRLGGLHGPAGRGRVRLVLGHADSVVAASPDDAAALERAGIDRARLTVRSTEPAATPGPDAQTGPDGRRPAVREPWGLSEEPGREELEDAVRRRATEDR